MAKLHPTKTYAFDFECTSREPSEVYLCAIARFSKLEKRFVKVYFNIADTVEYIFTRANKSVFFAHNLKYDISFVLCYLFQKHAGEFEVEHSIVQDMTKSVMCATIKFMGRTIKFIDTVPIFSTSLDAVLKAFTDMEKGETPLFDYAKDVVVTQDIIDYCITDSLGLAKAVLKRREHGVGALTTASDAFKEMKAMINQQSPNRFERFYSPIDAELDEYMRQAYRGGFSYLNPAHQRQVLYNVKVIDVNSMYPSMMYNQLLPFGEPAIIQDGEVIPSPLHPLGIQVFTIDWAYLKDDCTPFLSTSNTLLQAANYLSEIESDLPEDKRTFHLTLQEFELFKKSYDYSGLVLKGGFKFKARKDTFKPYIDKYWKMKEDKNPTIKNIGKLFLNAPYGKFAEGMHKNSYNVYYDEGLHWELESTEVKPCGYLPCGIFITSYARCFLINTINKIGVDNFIYCDTDSIHYFDVDNNDEGIEFHPTKLGAWDFENRFTRAYYVRAKRYCGEYEDGGDLKLKIACAGIKKKDLKEQIVRFEDFKEGRPINTIEFKQGVNGQYVRDKVIKI